jgi:hypothetical protein
MTFMRQPGRGFLRSGDVPNDADDEFFTFLVRVEIFFGDDRVDRPSGVGEFFLVNARLAGVEDRLVLGPGNLGLILGEKIVGRLAENFLPPEPKKIMPGVVEQHPAVLPVFDKQGIANGIDDPFQKIHGYHGRLRGCSFGR